MRARIAGVTALACVLAGVGACADRDGGGGDDDRAVAGICTPVTAQAATTDPSGVAAPTGLVGDAAAFDDCLHRWGYRLARSDDAAEIVAQATVAACAPALARWNQSSLTQTPVGGDNAVSLVTGENATTLVDRYQAAGNKALFYVVQARAGNCALPPETTTAPATK